MKIKVISSKTTPWEPYFNYLQCKKCLSKIVPTNKNQICQVCYGDGMEYSIYRKRLLGYTLVQKVITKVDLDRTLESLRPETNYYVVNYLGVFPHEPWYRRLIQ